MDEDFSNITNVNITRKQNKPNTNNKYWQQTNRNDE